MTPKARLARKLRTKPGRAAYSRRRAIIEPVFGPIDTGTAPMAPHRPPIPPPLHQTSPTHNHPRRHTAVRRY